MNDQNTLSTIKEVNDLKEQCAALRTQTVNLQIALLVAVVMLAGFFWLEVRRSGQMLRVLRPQAVQVAEASRKVDPAIQNIVAKLAEYGRTDRDFTTILTKYGISITSAPVAAVTAPASVKPATSPAPVITPKPAPATAPKK